MPVRPTRRFTMIGLTALLVVGTLVAADRVLATWLEKQVARRAAEAMGLGSEPSVRLYGFPVTPQLFEGLERIDIEMEDLPTGDERRVPISSLNARLESVDKSGDQVHVGRASGTVRLSYQDLESATGLTFRADSQREDRVVAEAELPFVGPIQVSARIEVEDGSGIALSAVETPGVRPELADRLTERLTRQPIASPDLPEGVKLSRVETTGEDIAVHLAGADFEVSPEGRAGG